MSVDYILNCLFSSGVLKSGGKHKRDRQLKYGVPRQRHHVVSSQPGREPDESGVRGVLFYRYVKKSKNTLHDPAL